MSFQSKAQVVHVPPKHKKGAFSFYILQIPEPETTTKKATTQAPTTPAPFLLMVRECSSNCSLISSFNCPLILFFQLPLNLFLSYCRSTLLKISIET